MANTTSSFKNVNLLSKVQYDGISDPSKNELWAVETPVVVESYVGGSNWYRVYSDGWVEQGGVIALNGPVSSTNKIITFLKPMKDTNYFRGACSNANSGCTIVAVGWESNTKMTIGTPSGVSTTGLACWLVMGYGA